MAIIDSPTLQRSGPSDDTAPEADALASQEDRGSAATSDAGDDAASSPDITATPPVTAAHPLPATPAPSAPGRQSAFLAELARAMNAAADAQRSIVLERASLDARAFVEQVQTRSAEESAELKRNADKDIAGIREWSKAEVARIREETEARIGDRKAELDSQLAQHAATVAVELDRVERRAAAFEAEMTAFFERLLQESDPARFAALAANLPEPPTFEDVAPSDEPEATAEEPDVSLEGDDDEAATAGSPALTEAAETEGADGTASIQDLAGDDAAPGEDTAPAEASRAEDMEHSLAEAEAAAAADAVDGDVDEPAGEELERGSASVWAARLAGIVGRGQPEAPASEAPADATAPTQVTQVVVVGLVSVASIAGFKRQLGHLPGVASVAVSSGPDGEFVFRVSHGDGLVLRDSIPTLPGFQARVVSFATGIVHVSARDPEAES